MYKQIVCTEQVPFGHSPASARIIGVGITSALALRRLRESIEEVIANMIRGDVYYTVGSSSGKVALVEKYYCTACGRYHIRSAADAVYDNNLDSLSYCNWQSAA